VLAQAPLRGSTARVEKGEQTTSRLQP
jgi:hypothetical protein